MKIIRESILDERLIGRSDTSFGDEQFIPVYLNPIGLDLLGPWTRGISLPNGDFYVGKKYNLIHIDIINFLCEIGILKDHPRSYFGPGGYMKLIAWQREDKTSDFYLGESYDDWFLEKHKKEMTKMIMNINKTEIPINFISEIVPCNSYS